MENPSTLDDKTSVAPELELSVMDNTLTLGSNDKPVEDELSAVSSTVPPLDELSPTATAIEPIPSMEEIRLAVGEAYLVAVRHSVAYYTSRAAAAKRDVLEWERANPGGSYSDPGFLLRKRTVRVVHLELAEQRKRLRNAELIVDQRREAVEEAEFWRRSSKKCLLSLRSSKLTWNEPPMSVVSCREANLLCSMYNARRREMESVGESTATQLS